MHCLKVAITTPEGESWGYPYIKISPYQSITHPAQEKVGHTTGLYVPCYFSRTVVWVLLRHKNQVSESAARRDLRFFVLFRED